MGDPMISTTMNKLNLNDTDISQKEEPRKIVETKVLGKFRWFKPNVGYGFIKRFDTKKDIFFHHSDIAGDNSKKAAKSLRGKVVEFDILLGETGFVASNISEYKESPRNGN